MSEQALQIIDRLDVLICGLDQAGTIQVYNEPCERITGVRRADAVGQNWIDLFAAGVRAEHVLALWSRARENAASGPFEALCRNQRNLRWQFSRHEHEVLPHVTLWAVGIDVTAERDALVRARELERTRTLANLVSGLTHELRNPLNGILLQLAVAERTLTRRFAQDIDPIVAAITQASGEARRIARILDDFLVVARPLPVSLRRTEIQDVVERAIERTAARAKASGVTVTLEGGDGVVGVIDPARVESAVYQLLANAIDAAAECSDKTAIVKISVVGNSVVIDTEDRGSGIESPDSPLFEPFFTTKTGGTGLGLAIVQRVAVDHGGTITHDRRDGVTVFRLELPIVAGVVT